MPLAQLIDVSLAFGHVPLLDHASLVIEPSSRIGLIGRNGTGKSTLLKLLAGIAHTDDGEVWLAPGLKLAYVPQEPAFEAGHTVYEAVAEGLGEARAVMVEYHALTHSLGNDAEPAQLERLHDLQEALDAHDGWTLQHRIDGIVSKLELPAERLVEELSGGLKKRVALARAWVMEPDLLLIDEPTNHLDIPGIEWLEQTLATFRGSVLCVTHDRRFLDSVAQQIVELDRGHLSAFPGNFSAFQVRKAEALEAEAQQDRQFDKVLAQEEVWIRKGIQARRTRNEGRVRRLEALRRERAARRERVGRVELSVDAGDRSGKLVAELENVSKRFGERTVVREFSSRLLRGDKVGLIGPNGSGKTTLLKLILGQLQPDEGKVHQGTKIEVAYFDQFRAALDEDATLVDTISQGSDTIEIGGRRKHVIGYLEEFLFPPERARAQVKSLSGGERNRLLLARLFSRPANVLVLDEPTNDLDVETLELLEELLQDYSGTLFLVSHDRTFLDNVVTQTIAYEGDGAWKEYAGGYSDWEKVRTRPESMAPAKPSKGQPDKVVSVETPKPPAAKTTPPKAAVARLNAREKRELDELPAKLEALEKEHVAVQQRLADPALYQSEAAEVKKANERNAELERSIATAYARWEELEARR